MSKLIFLTLGLLIGSAVAPVKEAPSQPTLTTLICKTWMVSGSGIVWKVTCHS